VLDAGSYQPRPRSQRDTFKGCRRGAEHRIPPAGTRGAAPREHGSLLPREWRPARPHALSGARVHRAGPSRAQQPPGTVVTGGLAARASPGARAASGGCHRRGPRAPVCLRSGASRCTGWLRGWCCRPSCRARHRALRAPPPWHSRHGTAQPGAEPVLGGSGGVFSPLCTRPPRRCRTAAPRPHVPGTLRPATPSPALTRLSVPSWRPGTSSGAGPRSAMLPAGCRMGRLADRASRAACSTFSSSPGLAAGPPGGQSPPGLSQPPQAVTAPPAPAAPFTRR